MQLNHNVIQNILSSSPVEADVWFIGTTDEGHIFTQPWWECEMEADELPIHALRCAVRWNEAVGHGEVAVQTIDLRTPSLKDKLLASLRETQEKLAA